MSRIDKEPHIITKHLSRRVLIRSGLAGLATTLVSSQLTGCTTQEKTGYRDSLTRTNDLEDPSIVNPSMLMDSMDETESVMEADQFIADDRQAQDLGVIDEDSEVDMYVDIVPPDFPIRNVPPPANLVSMISVVGPLLEANEHGLRLPEGFQSRIIARTGENVGNTDLRWHLAPDGGASYPTEDGGWIYVSNSEVAILGGVNAIRFNEDGDIVEAYPILQRTNDNCAGGITPWHTWLSCEETPRGRVYECSPWGDQEAILRTALGIFKHEAVAVDAIHGHLYLTEDEVDGAFYRFTPDQMNSLGFPDLNSGQLEVASVSELGAVSWTVLPDPEFNGDTPTRYQIAELTPFNGGEGIWCHNSIVYFSTKGDNKVWAYHTQTHQLDVIYDGRSNLEGVDNLTVSCCGDVLVAEDGGNMQIVAILPNGELKTLVKVEGQDGSEITGPAFDPSGTRLYFSSQRGPADRDSDGITYEISGPFHRLS